MLGVAALFHDHLGELGGPRPGLRRPGDEQARRPLDMLLMRLGHVLRLCRVLAGHEAAHVRGDPFAVGIQDRTECPRRATRGRRTAGCWEAEVFALMLNGVSTARAARLSTP